MARMQAANSTEATPGSTNRRKTDSRFERKRQLVLNAATELMNRHGIKGMTLAQIADNVGLNTSSVTYYYPVKDQLAAAVFERTLDRIDEIVAAAKLGETPRQRVEHYVASYIDLHLSVWRDGAPPIASLSDMRALDDSVRLPVAQHYAAIFRKIRGFFGPTDNSEQQALQTARAQVLTETMYWLPRWLKNYEYRDFPRVRDRLLALFDTGLAKPQAVWQPHPLSLNREIEVGTQRANFLRAATRLINDHGYRGASVDRIVAELNVTKGSFYHHLDAKTDLAHECFSYSFAVIAEAQRLADGLAGDHWVRLSSVIAALLELQLFGEWPLMRMSAIQTLPADLRPSVLARSTRLALHFAGVIIDGISAGDLRPVDPLISSQFVMSGLNAAYEHRSRAIALGDRPRAVALYASALAFGLFS